MSDIVFRCAHCDQSLAAPEDLAGEFLSCPGCGLTVEVPVLEVEETPVQSPKQRKLVTTKARSSSSQGSRRSSSKGSKRQSGSRDRRKNRPKSDRPASAPPPMINMIFGIIGSLILILGVFAPIVSAPIVGNINYFQNGKGDGIIVLVLAVVALIISLTRMYKLLWIPFVGCAGMLTFTFVNFQQGMSDLRSEMQTGLADNPFAGLAEVALESVQLQWGFAVLIIGTVMLLLGATLPARQ